MACVHCWGIQLQTLYLAQMSVVLIVSAERAGQSALFFMWHQEGPSRFGRPLVVAVTVGSVSSGSQVHFLEARMLQSGPFFKKPSRSINRGI